MRVLCIAVVERCIVRTPNCTTCTSSISTWMQATWTLTIVSSQDWSREEVKRIYEQPLLELVYQAATVHRIHFDPREVQQCTLLSIKTGGCTEDCKYCSQSVKHKTFVKPEPRKKVDEVLEMAARAKKAGSTRFCMGSAWREVGKKNAFNDVLTMVREVNSMGMEVCCTLGMLTEEQAVQLKEAGLAAYNHNLDTSREHYPNVISTRTYDDRLNTIANVRKAGISVCCGGILGIGEKEHDRVALLHTLATMEEHPESVPVNALVSVVGTPLASEDLPPVTAFDMARTIATARILMPKTMVRLSAGRMSFSDAEQGLLFMAGANSIFNGDTLLTTANPAFEKDNALFTDLGLVGKPSHVASKKTPYVVKVTHSRSDDAAAEPQVASM
ncbi:hypothetical protein B5M09_009182 [Aphanomyces astaci]|uniref:biotin synthase n=1 Tax=Aphanomyces astaci TaxID=112090 RepID=A0A3R7WR95_APHAT|nr:hypothetical protein B5M09_009182 [Aphanomyces astaci]